MKKYSELAKEPYGIISAAPYGKITNREQYDYMMAFEKRSNFGFYWSDDDRHKPTYEECYGKYLSMGSFFGGASFFLMIEEKYYVVDYEDKHRRTIEKDQEWSYGEYGKIDLAN